MPEKLIRLDMSRDAGVHPGLVERAFRKSSWATYRDRTGKQNAIAGIVEKATKEAAQEADCEALDRLQAQRPLAPPGRIKLKEPTPSTMPAGGSPLRDQQPGASAQSETMTKESTEQKSKP